MEHTKEQRSEEVFETLNKMLSYSKKYDIYKIGSIITIKTDYIGDVASRDIFNYLTTARNLKQLHFALDFDNKKVIIFIDD